MTTEKNTPFDIAQFETTDSATLTLLTPKGDEMIVGGQPVVITLYGPGSKQQVVALRKNQKAAKAALFASMNGRPPKNAEEDEAIRDAEYLAACTASISGNFPVPALQVYGNTALSYISKQVRAFLADEANFMSSSPQS